VRSDARTAGGGDSADEGTPDVHLQPWAEVLASRRRSTTSSGEAAVEEDDGRRSSVRENQACSDLSMPHPVSIWRGRKSATELSYHERSANHPQDYHAMSQEHRSEFSFRERGL